jgi:four helix bundle protein
LSMATFKSFEEIVAWQLASQLCREIGQVARETPLSRDFKLRDQILDSSDSIKSNIAEGFGRMGNREFKNFLHISHASCEEVKSQLTTVLERSYLTQAKYDELHFLARRTSIAIYKLIRYLQKSDYRGPRYFH